MNYIPAGIANNALLRVAFIIEFERNFSQEELQSVDNNHTDWKSSLPRRSVVKGGLVLNPQSPQINLDQSVIFGFKYNLFNKDGTVREGLHLQDNKVIYLVGEYTVWNEVWPKATKILEPVLQLLPESNKVISYSSEYTDLFLVQGDYFNNDPTSLFRSDSDLIPKHIFKRKLNWHSHTGYFEEIVTPVLHRHLTRLNIDIRDNNNRQQRELTMRLFHSITPPHKPLSQESLSLPEEITSIGLDNFRILHLKARELLKKLLCNDMLEKIGINP